LAVRLPTCPFPPFLFFNIQIDRSNTMFHAKLYKKQNHIISFFPSRINEKTKKKMGEANLLRTRSVKLPSKSVLDILLQVTGNLDGANISRMPLRADVVVLQNPCRVEPVHEWLVLAFSLDLGRLLGDAIVSQGIAEVVVRVEPLDQLLDLFHPTLGCVGQVRVAGLVEAEPERHDDHLGVGPFPVNALDDFGEGVDVGRRRDIVVLVVIVGADHDDCNISSGLLAEIPGLGVI